MEAGNVEAEFAIVAGDAWQGMGLGARLLSSLVQLARPSGVRRLFGSTLTENTAMLRLGRRLGFKLAQVPGDAFVTMISLDLHPPVSDPARTR
jgi:acetyltransferase